MLIGYAFCGSFCTLSKSITEMKKLKEAGHELLPIMSGNAYATDTRFGTAEEIREKISAVTSRPIVHTIPDAERISRTAGVYRNYLAFWRKMGWYDRYKKLLQFTGARWYYDTLHSIRPENGPLLYEQCLKDNGFSGADFLFFRLLHAAWQVKGRLTGT